MASSTNTFKVTLKQFLPLDSKPEDIISHFKNKKTNVLEAVFGLLQRALDYYGSISAFFLGFKEVICIKTYFILSL